MARCVLGAAATALLMAGVGAPGVAAEPVGPENTLACNSINCVPASLAVG